jgi:hypothetical protein
VSTAAGTSLPVEAAAAGTIIATAAISRNRPSASLVAPGSAPSLTSAIESQMPASSPIPVPATASRAR